MDPLTIIEYGENLRDLFEQSVDKAEKHISGNLNVEKKQIRFSPEIGATVNDRYFTVEYSTWEFSADGKPVAYLDTMYDAKGEFFEIDVRPL